MPYGNKIMPLVVIQHDVSSEWNDDDNDDDNNKDNER